MSDHSVSTTTSWRPQILAVDDDTRLLKLLGKFLSEHGFDVLTASNAHQARSIIEVFNFDLVILDNMMPGESGIELLKNWQPDPRPPVLFLSAKYEVDDRIQGLEIGADDYLAKPFEPKELVLRINSILRRFQSAQHFDSLISFGPCSFNLKTKSFLKSGVSVALTVVESQLLEYFLKNEGATLTREDLQKQIGHDAMSLRSVDVQITRLRKKIELNAHAPIHLLTVRNVGYVFWRQH